MDIPIRVYKEILKKNTYIYISYNLYGIEYSKVKLKKIYNKKKRGRLIHKKYLSQIYRY